MRALSIILLLLLAGLVGLVCSGENEEKEQELAKTLAELNATKAELERVKIQLNQTLAELNEAKARIEVLKRDYYLLRKNITFKDVRRFLWRDDTDVHGKGLCYHRAIRMWHNAVEDGLFASPVVLTFPGAGHMIIAFNTTDKGIVYVDPELDVFVNVTLGRDYFEENELCSRYSGVVRDYAHFWDYEPKSSS